MSDLAAELPSRTRSRSARQARSAAIQNAKDGTRPPAPIDAAPTAPPDLGRRPVGPGRCMSHVLPATLAECPASGRGRFATVGVLDAGVRIERAETLASDVYRIAASFVVETTVVAFDHSFQRHARFFESVSLRFLTAQNSRTKTQTTVRPLGDAAVRNVPVTRSRDTSAGASVGIGAGAVTATPVPLASVQATRDFKVAYERPMSSWRLSLSSSPYAPNTAEDSVPLLSRLAAHLVPAGQQLLPRTPANIASTVPQLLQQAYFCAGSASLQKVPQPQYDCAVLWSWQTESALRLWTPEVYGVLRAPITIVREVPVSDVDVLSDEEVQGYLAFDFEVDVQLRVLGVGVGSLLGGVFGQAARPADMRRQTDTGEPLPPDRVFFTVACAPADISWPLYVTRCLQDEADAGAARHQPGTRLQTNDEFRARLAWPPEPAVHVFANEPRAAADAWWDEAPSLTLPAIVPVSVRQHMALYQNQHQNQHGWARTSSLQAAGEDCRCQTLTSAQKRRYHCCIDCQYGHTTQPVQRPRTLLPGQ